MSNSAQRVRDGHGVERLVWAAAAPVESEVETRDIAAEHEAALGAMERHAFAAGYAKGEEAADQRVKAQVRRIAETIGQLQALRSVIIHEAESELVKLASAIAGAVLRREVAIDRSILVAIARAAIDRLGESRQATVHLHPDDHAAITELQMIEFRSMQIVPDPTVQLGGCLVHSELGTIEAGVAVQLEELTAMLLQNDVPLADERWTSADTSAA